ncbi:unnamed protein product, partial [Prorocentrum cordatum]
GLVGGSLYAAALPASPTHAWRGGYSTSIRFAHETGDPRRLRQRQLRRLGALLLGACVLVSAAVLAVCGRWSASAPPRHAGRRRAATVALAAEEGDAYDFRSTDAAQDAESRWLRDLQHPSGGDAALGGPRGNRSGHEGAGGGGGGSRTFAEAASESAQDNATPPLHADGEAASGGEAQDGARTTTSRSSTTTSLMTCGVLYDNVDFEGTELQSYERIPGAEATELRQPRSILPDFHDTRLTSVSSPFRIFSGAIPAIRPLVDFPSGRFDSGDSDHSIGTSTWACERLWITTGRSAHYRTWSTSLFVSLIVCTVDEGIMLKSRIALI